MLKCHQSCRRQQTLDLDQLALAAMNDVSGSSRFDRGPAEFSPRPAPDHAKYLDRSDEPIARLGNVSIQSPPPSACASTRLKRRDLHGKIASETTTPGHGGVEDLRLLNEFIGSLDERGKDCGAARTDRHGTPSRVTIPAPASSRNGPISYNVLTTAFRQCAP
jgi:hypothetical protein